MVEVKENDELIVDIKRLGINGEGIAYYKKLAIFVDGAIPGEGVKIRITKVLPKMAFGEIIQIMHKSPDRVEPKCKYYKDCGGCQLMHIDYSRTKELKRDLVIEALNRYSHLNVKSFEIKQTLQMENPDGYRAKSQLPLGYKDDHLCVGLFDTNSKTITFIDDCVTQDENVNRVNREVCKILEEEKISAFNKQNKTGDIRHIVTRVSKATGEIQVTLVKDFKHKDLTKAAKKIINIDGVVSVFESFKNSSTPEIFGKEIKLLEGKEKILEKIGDCKYELSPSAFFQLNPVQTKVIYDEVKKAAKLSKKEVVLDLYCGTGTIGIYLANNSKKVLGVELNKEAIKDAKQNAVLNKLNNIDFISEDVDKALPMILKNENKIDVLVCDPPRTGLGAKVCNTIMKHNINRIVYVSCNPATLAKDLYLLRQKYNVRYIQPIDQFPYTAAVECVVLLDKKK